MFTYFIVQLLPRLRKYAAITSPSHGHLMYGSSYNIIKYLGKFLGSIPVLTHT